jgi:alpha-ketoglutarate-dependent taurine dioxygenase
MTQTFAPSLLKVDLQPGRPPLLQVGRPVDPEAWTAEHGDTLHAIIDEHGSLLVRGLGLRDANRTASVFRQLDTLMNETEAFASRKRYAPGVYSSSKWPPNQPMCMHHELSYALEVPGIMLFACLVAPSWGGGTPVADSQGVLGALPAGLVERFERTGWLLVRNYNEEIGASIAESFGTDDRQVVEEYCRSHAIRFEWQPGGGLRTWQRRSAVIHHPCTGQRCWFNQVAFLSEWTLAPEIREYLVELYGENGLPFNTLFGNGDPIDEEIVRTINEAYEANTLLERWQPGDLLMVDNIRMAHGREAFDGPREVVVAMADPVSVAEFPPSPDSRSPQASQASQAPIDATGN